MTAPGATAREVLGFWFGDARPVAPRPEWFRKDEAFDRSIEQRYGPLIELALRDGLQAWALEAEAALARVIVLDQFTRNAYRNTPRAFAGDNLALRAARALLARGQDQQLEPVQRVFVYLPFEHAEDLAAQEESVRLFSQLEAHTASGQNWLEYARRHRDIVARFGRFPHRNAILGRASTPEELSFLQQPGSSF